MGLLSSPEAQPSVDVIYSPNNRDNTGPGASGQVLDVQGHLQDGQEQLLDHFKKGFTNSVLYDS